MDTELDVMTLSRLHRIHSQAELAMDLAEKFGYRRSIGALKNCQLAVDEAIEWIKDNYPYEPDR